MAPGFTPDCVETLEGNRIENRHFFASAGGVNYATVPCLNDSDEGMKVIYTSRRARASRLDLIACADTRDLLCVSIMPTFSLGGQHGCHNSSEEILMRTAKLAIGVLATAALLGTPQVEAKPGGCLKYGAAGAVAGHYAGHHAFKGAVAGCIAGMVRRA